MPNYISKNALNTIPQDTEDVTQVNSGNLRSTLFQGNIYLNSLARNTVGVSPLRFSDKSSGDHVKLIKVALNTIDKLYLDFNLSNPLNAKDNLFDANLRDALIVFQGLFPELTANGELDTMTLLTIDRRLMGPLQYDNEKQKFLGKLEGKSFNFHQGFTEIGGENVYTVTYELFENGQPYSYAGINPITGEVVAFDSEKAFIVPDEKTKKMLRQQFTNHPEFQVLRIGLPNTKLKAFPQDIPFNDFQQIVDDTPPSVFNDPGEKLYTIQPGDTVSNIILQNYYNQGTLAIPNEYHPGTNITEFEPIAPLDIAHRHDDARFQYYINLIYYYNSVEDENSNVTEWGITLNNGHKRYEDDHLESVNLFDNKFEASNPITAMPNYYRFLKEMESIDQDYKINFDTAGQTTSFQTVVGKKIRIPSRKFAEALYNHLNFRANEMLTNVQNNVDAVREYITDELFEDAIDAFTSAINTVQGIATAVKNEAIALYRKVRKMFKDIYNYLIDVLSHWPRGLGGEMSIGGGVTWGIPIKTEIEKSRRIYRQLTKSRDLVLVYSKESVLDVSADVAFGVKANLGAKMGNSKKKKSFGLKAGGNVNSGIRGTMSTEYEFPLRQDETALLSMVITMLSSKFIDNLSDALEYLDVINLNPRQYITKFSVSLENNTNADVGIAIGLSNPKAIKVNADNRQTPAQQNEQKSYASVDNIWEKIPGVTAGAEGTFTMGLSFEYTVDYGGSPSTNDSKGRVFKSIDMDIKSYIRGTAEAELASDILKKIMSKSLPTIFVPGRFNLLSFDQGVMLGLNYKLERNTNPNAIVADDFDYPEILSAPVYGVSGNDIKYETYNDSGNISKSMTIYVGSYSGDIETICEPGTEFKLYLSAPKLYDLLFNSSAVLNLEFIKSLFNKLECRKKIGFSYNVGERKTVKKKAKVKKIDDKGTTNTTVDAFKNGDHVEDEIRYISKALSYAQDHIGDPNIYLDFGLALDVKMGITLDSLDILLNCFKYYLIKLYCSVEFDPDEFITLKSDISNHVDKIQKVLSGNSNIPSTEVKLIELMGKKYYEQIYSDNDVIYTKPNPSNPNGPPITVQTDVPGLLKYISNYSIPGPGSDVDVDSDMKGVIRKMINGISHFLEYLNNLNTNTKNFNSEYGFETILDLFSFLAVIGDTEATLEAKLGASFEASIKAGEGLTAGISLSGEARVIYIAKFMENGLFVTDSYDSNDPMRKVFNSIKASLAPGIENKRDKIKTVFKVTNNAS